MIPGNNLFDNPMVRKAKESMTPAQQLHFQEIGRQYYGRINFDNFQPEPVEPNRELSLECLQLDLCLRVGKDPETLTDYEKSVLVEHYGSNWRARYS
jgi:hypothetical protein